MTRSKPIRFCLMGCVVLAGHWAGAAIEDYESAAYQEGSKIRATGDFVGDGAVHWKARAGQGIAGSTGIEYRHAYKKHTVWGAHSVAPKAGDTLIASIDFRFDPLDASLGHNHAPVAYIQIGSSDDVDADRTHLRLVTIQNDKGAADAYKLYFDHKGASGFFWKNIPRDKLESNGVDKLTAWYRLELTMTKTIREGKWDFTGILYSLGVDGTDQPTSICAGETVNQLNSALYSADHLSLAFGSDGRALDSVVVDHLRLDIQAVMQGKAGYTFGYLAPFFLVR